MHAQAESDTGLPGWECRPLHYSLFLINLLPDIIVRGAIICSDIDLRKEFICDRL